MQSNSNGKWCLISGLAICEGGKLDGLWRDALLLERRSEGVAARDYQLTATIA